MNHMLVSYLVYTVAAIALTGILARTLFRNGKVFLNDVFDSDGMADAVNHLLVVGFYMLNLGYALIIFRTSATATGLETTENLVTKLGVLLLSLGVIHFVNIAVFWKLRRRNEMSLDLPPVRPTTHVVPPPAAGSMISPA